MATIKTQNGKILLKNGKVSCECCDDIPDCAGEPPEKNSYAITKEKYIEFYNGGTWNISFNGVNNETTNQYIGNPTNPGSICGTAGSQYRPATNSVTINGNASFISNKTCSFTSSGASGTWQQVSTINGDSFSNSGTAIYQFAYNLIRKKINGTDFYYVVIEVDFEGLFSSFTWFTNSNKCETTQTNTPSNVSDGLVSPAPDVNINGVSVSGCSVGTASPFGGAFNWVCNNGYTRAQTFNLNISFTPNV